jgi:hypothetical protein
MSVFIPKFLHVSQHHICLFDCFLSLGKKMAAKGLIRKLLNLNLFVNPTTRNSDDIEVIHDQVLSTRVYIVLLTVIILIITLFTILRPVLVTETVLKPSLEVYLQLEIAHASTLSCICRQSTVQYARFFSMKPVYHQVCCFEIYA